MFVSEGLWEVDSEETVAASIITALHFPGLKAAVRCRFEYKREEKKLDQVIGVENRMKSQWQTFEKYETDRKMTSQKAAGKKCAHHGGQQQRAQSSAVAAASKPTARVPVEE